MKIAFCLIIKDNSEIKGLKRVCASVAPYVDSIHITATGNKVKLIKRFCKEQNYDYSYFKWVDDFSAARNFNFARAGDTDWILWLDTDDELIGAKYLRKLAKIALKKELNAVFLTYWYGCRFKKGLPQSYETLEEIEMEHMRERLLKPNSIVWKGRLHETPVPVDGANYKYLAYRYDAKKAPMAILHYGADRNISSEAMNKRLDRNKRILELQVEDERSIREGGVDPRTLLYLMKIYSDMEDKKLWKKCIDMGWEYLTKSGWNEERGTCYMQMAKCWGKLGDNYKSIELLHGAIKEWPYQPLLYLMLAQGYFNVGDYRATKHWMTIGLRMEYNHHSASMDNILEMKILGAELTMKYLFYGEKNLRKAYKASLEVYKINPTDENKDLVKQLYDLKELDLACEHTDKLVHYLDDIGEEKILLGVLNILPKAITKQPFAKKLINRFAKPRRWEDYEICYFANFGGKHFEEWSAKSLKKGIGGSETAVIELAKEWTKYGYRVTVYGDPGKEEGDHEGVTYLPWYAFNIKDRFNIFIQWRSGSLAGKISCKKFLVDLHDIYNEIDLKDKLDGIDKIMVKSKYQRSLAPNIPDNKFLIISNGLRL